MGLLQRVGFGFGRWNRSRKARFAIRIGDLVDARCVLLVGVSGVEGASVNNLVESRLAQHFPDVVASGIDVHAIGWDAYVAADARQLPFRDQSFDLVYANAVIEHVGDELEQRRFVEELGRVGKVWIITTPNRWFPIEAHYHTLVTHWRRSWGPRGTVTRLLGVRDFRALLPSGVVRGVPVVSPTLTAVGPGDAPNKASV